jgi:tRNA threonylcarbamoyladenosine biosynthesis protein TsaE
MSAGGWRRVASSSAACTHAIGRALRTVLAGGDTVLLVGPMGAGKTALAQGIGEGLGARGPITSPTFTLVRDYDCDCESGTGGVRHFLHADVYRVDTVAAIEDLGMDELVDAESVLVVEWGEAAAPVLDPAALRIRLDLGDGDDDRVLVFEGDAWAPRHGALDAALARCETR